jgi:hypothetical protein
VTGARVRRRNRLQTSPAPPAPAVCRRDLASSHRVSGHAGRPCPAEWADGPTAIAAGPRARDPSDRGARLGANISDARLAAGDVTQRHESPVAARFAALRVTQPTTGASDGWLPRSGFLRAGFGRHAAHQILLLRPAGHRVDQAIGPTRASTLGDRAAISRTEDGTRVGPFRRTLLPGLAASRRAHGRRIRVPPARADAARRRLTLTFPRIRAMSKRFSRPC